MCDIVENNEIDKDTVGVDEIEKLFSKKYNLLAETAVTLKATYINKISLNKSLNIAVSLLDNSIEVYKLDKSSLHRVCKLSGHKKSLTELVFSPKEEHLLYSSGHDGIKLWDTRTSGLCVQEYKDEEDSEPRPYEAMDVSISGRVICAGSQLVKDDAYMVFWDQRKPEPLGGYWNSHTDDITQVKFHKEKSEILVSGSMDGLLNVYNILEETEDDALTYSMNIENSVEKITWLDECRVSCVTQSNDLQIWDTSTGDLVKSYNRDKLARSIKRLRSDDCYLVDTYTTAEKNMVILAGSYGEENILRTVTENKKKLQPTTNFTKNKQTVRCCAYNEDLDILITAGESGLINVWGTAESPEATAISKKLNNNLKLHDKRHKPY